MTNARQAVAPPMWLLVLITISGTMAMHMFVPALPAAAHALGSTAGQMQMAISIYIIGCAVVSLIALIAMPKPNQDEVAQIPEDELAAEVPMT